MTPKKRPKAPTSTTMTVPKPPTVLVQEALDDLHYIEPARSRNRLISALNEAFLRILALERLHQEPTVAPKPKPRRRQKK